MTAPASQALTVRSMLNAVLADELEASPATLLLGETVRGVGAAGIAAGLYDRFGEEQVIETPVSENAIFASALGLALAGMRPVVEIYSADFLLAVANEVMNDIAKWRHQQTTPGGMPITIRGCMGANEGLGPEHSQCMEPFLFHAPGLTVVTPGSAADAAGLLRASIRSDDPVVFLEHRRVYDLEAAPADKPDYLVPLGVAETVREGEDVTVVAWGWMRQEAEIAATSLADRGISVELIDPRTIKPMDWDAITASALRTGRLVVVEEAPITGGVAAEVVARVLEAGAGKHLQIARVAMPDAIHPYSATMEEALLPNATHVVEAVERLCR